MNTSKRIAFIKLVDTYLSGKANARQLNAIERYFDLFSTRPDVLENANRFQVREIRDRMKTVIDRRIDEAEAQALERRKKWWRFRWLWT